MPVAGSVITIVDPLVSQLIPLDSNIAEQDALSPPLIPLHGHEHELPTHDTVPSVPAEQRLVLGASTKLPPFAKPHTPSTGVLDSPMVTA